ncbi:glucosamine-6-phosphate deaminase [Gracilibacillus halophilus YIM-C55.5]|uniref:Glucosamine-6-phosphate deaminase n=1 Tax=Gracilibacillus halophilus YIM-C55.5 TaxID=1308866 RepID=N4WNK2_9BACI|nr:glucosamine-6-phosphate deaminase [Gracilibacillus halophilus]ENH97717.1 glucosamine-6-phosphate deaminase [Gracilibacillus halophilus YIM-C55.5]
MNIIQATNYQDMSNQTAELIIDTVRNNDYVTLGLATGGTPKGTYQQLVKDHQLNQTSYQHVTTFNLDEYVGMRPTDPNSYRYYMDQYFFDEVDIPEQNIHIPNGMAEDLPRECARYEKQIDDTNGIDLQILGIGKNGHIGFNEPGTAFESTTHVVELAHSTRKANARFFNHLDDVPTHAITMGIATIMKSKQILLLASGEDKAEAIRKLIHEEVDEHMPASVLRHHSNVTIIADQNALVSA